MASTCMNTEFSLECVWSEHHKSLSETLNDNKLPLIVKISHDYIVKSEEDTPFDFNQPLLLYKELKRYKLYSRNISLETIRGKTKQCEVGPYVVIPQEYPGLFLRLEDLQDDENDQISTIAAIARLMPATFLSLSICNGFIATTQRGRTIVYSKRKDIQPGLFYVMNIHEDLVTYVNSRKSEKRRLMVCLRCITEDRKTEVLFPFDTSGKLYVVDLRANHSNFPQNETVRRLYRISELMSPTNSGSVVKLIRGDPPTQNVHFTGFLKFSHVASEHTVIGCTMSQKLLELSVPHGPLFAIALNDNDINGELISLTRDESLKSSINKFIREMKIRKDYDVEKKDIRE